MNIAKLKEQVDVLEVLTKVGARVHRGNWWAEEVSVYCPFCEDATSSKPAGRANTLKGLYHCWACGFGGDVITIAEKYLGFEPGQGFEPACRWLIDTFDVKDVSDDLI